MRTTKGLRIFLAMAASCVLLACGSHYVAIEPAPSTPSVSPAPFTYDASVTAANGYGTGSRASLEEHEAAVARLRQFVTANPKQSRIVVYFNSRLSEFRARRSGTTNVLEVESRDGAEGAERVGRRTFRLYTEAAEKLPAASEQPLDAILANALETAVTADLLRANAHVVDKALLFRQVAQAASINAFSEAEIKALSESADLLIEIRFLPNAQRVEGFELTLRAIRTRDARLVAQVTTAELNSGMAWFIPTSGGRSVPPDQQAISLALMYRPVLTRLFNAMSDAPRD